MGLNKQVDASIKQAKYNVVYINEIDYIFTFGKYKDLTVDEVLLINPKYLLWLHDNTNCELSPDILNDVEEAVQNDTPRKCGWNGR